MAGPGRPAASGVRRPASGPSGRVELVIGGILLAWSFVAALLVRRSPGPNALDRWGLTHLPVVRHSTWMTRVTETGSLPVLVAGSLLAAVVTFGRDRLRAVTCLVGPVAATALCEWVIKPAVGRHYIGVLTFPSGHVTAVSALGTAWVLAVPRWLRLPVAALAAALVVLMAVSVVKLGWHYASDALAGAAVGCGVVLVVDGLLHVLAGPSAASRPGPPPS
jgi:membrane-associated phospholipid phosphatase